jgi:hypothetical protein
MSMQRSFDDVDFCAEMRRETERAVLMFDGTNEIWIPRSMIKGIRRIRDYDYELVIPQWLAKEKGII